MAAKMRKNHKNVFLGALISFTLSGIDTFSESIDPVAEEAGEPQLISYTCSSKPFDEVIEDIHRLTGAHIIAHPELTNYARISVSVENVEWRPALEAMMDSINFMVLESKPGIFHVGPKPDFSALKCLRYDQSAHQEEFSIELENAHWHEITEAIARAAGLNLAYDPRLEKQGNIFTVSLPNVKAEEALEDIIETCDLAVYRWKDYHIVAPKKIWPFYEEEENTVEAPAWIGTTFIVGLALVGGLISLGLLIVGGIFGYGFGRYRKKK